MLEHPSIRRYSFGDCNLSSGSENPSGADNQQETVDKTGSSETGRGAPAPLAFFRSPTEGEAAPVKVQSDPHGDMGSWAEMTRSVPD